MTIVFAVGIAFIAGLTIGGGAVMIWINQRKIPLDKWTNRFKINGNDLLAPSSAAPIGILDAECDDVEVCQITLWDSTDNERVGTAQWVAAALNRHRG